MNIIIYAGARVKPPFADAIEDYTKRISYYWHIERRILNPNKPLPNLSMGKPLSILLDESGKQVSTEELRDMFEVFIHSGGDEVYFFVGGSYGFSQDFKDRLLKRAISLSSLTLPHLLAETLLLEQIYRVQCLLRGHPYPH